MEQPSGLVVYSTQRPRLAFQERNQLIVELLGDYDLLVETHASGTNIEGELDTILDAVKTIHAVLHAEGTVRLVNYLKLETRTDKHPTLAGKRL